mmetsp:Transcript_2980/g.4970  ORF Transcript_2980/g.4970 Transcript_2980/m.4970 type:complete len:82 (-) Transcript_2980:1528-1773(-)
MTLPYFQHPRYFFFIHQNSLFQQLPIAASCLNCLCPSFFFLPLSSYFNQTGERQETTNTSIQLGKKKAPSPNKHIPVVHSK